MPPAPLQVPAGVSRPRSVPNWLLAEQALTAPNPGELKQAPDHPFRLKQGKPRFRPSDVFPASRRPSCGRPSGKPATFPRTSFRQAGDCPCRLFSIGRTRFPDRPFLSGRTLRVPFGLPGSKLPGRPFAVPSPEGSGPAGLRKSGFGLGFPRRLALLPGCPTRASLVSFPKDLDLIGTGGVAEFRAVSGGSSLTAKGQHDRPARVAQRESGPSSLWITWITWISRPICDYSAAAPRDRLPRSSSQPIKAAHRTCAA